MAQIDNPELKKLLLQARFSPEKQRLIQLDACDALLRLIQPGKSYPFEFVCFHLTGYRPRTTKTGDLIEYVVLIRDLGIYSEQLSRTLKIPVGIFAGKPYETVESLRGRFNVCEKTVSRWRRSGLIGRFVLFEDGKYRLVFLSGTVELFRRRQSHRVSRGEGFTLLSESDKDVILRRLVRMGRSCPQHRQESIRRVAKRFGRSVETVRSLLVEYEKSRYPQQVFAKRSRVLTEHQQNELYEQYAQGVGTADLMRRFGCSRSSVYRAVNLCRAAEISRLTIHYMPAEEFLQSEDESEFLVAPAGLFDVEKAEKKSSFIKSETDIDGYFAEIREAALLTGRQEQFLFRKYNYLKYKAAKIQKRVDIFRPQAREIRCIQALLAEAETVKERLIKSNLRLVVSVARKHAHREAEMMDLISEGNMALINAVEKFDYTRGVKLSTYATWAIFKRFASYKSKSGRYPSLGVEQEMLEASHDMRREESQLPALEAARKSLTEVMTETLEDREKIIVESHYGLSAEEKVLGQRKGKSLRQIAELFGLSKERVRQIELGALQKLRRVLTAEQFEGLVSG